MALGSHLITVRRLKKYIDDVIGKKANLPDTSKTIIGNISQINTDLSDCMPDGEYYELTANSGETWTNFLNRFYAGMDKTKVTSHATIEGLYGTMRLSQRSDSQLLFGNWMHTPQYTMINFQQLFITSSGSKYSAFYYSGGSWIQQDSSATAASGQTLRIYYH